MPEPLLTGKKILVLMEGDFYEPEILYYKSRFAEEGAEVHFVTKLWGQPSLTFQGHEHRMPFTVDRAFTELSDEDLASYAAFIVPSGFVSDRLRYTPDPDSPSEAVQLLRRAFGIPTLVKGIICHGMWLAAWAPDLIRGRPVTTHPNLVADVRNMGGVFVNEDVVVDGDLVTGRTGGHHAPFARRIIDEVAKRGAAAAKPAFAHVALNCRDLAATEAFYTGLFGFERSRVVDLGGPQIVFLRGGNVHLELFAAEGDREDGAGDGPHAAGVRHLAFQVADVDATLAALGDAAPVTLGPLGFDAFIPGWRTAWVRDPDGNVVEISQGYTDDPHVQPAAQPVAQETA